MQLTDEQKKTVADWVASGASLADVQRRVTETFGLAMTYMDVRFLVLELGVQVREKAVAPPRQADLSQIPAPPPTQAVADADSEAPGGPMPGAVTVELDRIMKPGSIVSGTVAFSDGVTAAWSLDQFGRLALNASRPGYSPAPEDVQAFQMELRRLLEKRGF